MADLANEYKATTEAAAWIHFSNSGIIEVQGSDRISFLNQITTNDIKNLKPGDSCQTAILSHTAKVLALMNVFISKDKILLMTEPCFDEKWIPLFEKYLITEDVELKSASKIYAAFGLIGPHASKTLKALQSDSVLSFSEPHKENGFIILTDSSNADTLTQKAISAGASSLSPETYEVFRIEIGLLRYGLDITDQISLPETGLDETAASETKGCYPGQEVVAKTKTYKGLQRKAVKIVLEGKELPQSGDKIHDAGQEIGWITSAVYSEKLQAGLALGYVRKGYFEDSKKVQIQTNSKLLGAKTLPLI